MNWINAVFSSRTCLPDEFSVNIIWNGSERESSSHFFFHFEMEIVMSVEQQFNSIHSNATVSYCAHLFTFEVSISMATSYPPCTHMHSIKCFELENQLTETKTIWINALKHIGNWISLGHKRYHPINRFKLNSAKKSETRWINRNYAGTMKMMSTALPAIENCLLTNPEQKREEI